MTSLVETPTDRDGDASVLSVSEFQVSRKESEEGAKYAEIIAFSHFAFSLLRLCVFA